MFLSCNYWQGAPLYINFLIKYTFLLSSPTQEGYIKFRADKESYNAIVVVVELRSVISSFVTYFMV